MELFAGILSIGFVILAVVALGAYLYDLLTNEYVDSPYEDELHL